MMEEKEKFTAFRAVFYALVAYTIWTLADCCTKMAGQNRVPVVQIIFFSSFFSAVTIFAVTAARGRLRELRIANPKFEILRASLFVAQAFANVLAFTNLPLVNVYIGLFTAPILIAVFAAVLMREPLSLVQGAAIVAGFAGALAALNPTSLNFAGGNAIGYVALLIFLVLFTINILMIRASGRRESGAELAFFPQAFRAAVLSPFVLFDYSSMGAEQTLYVFGLGFFGAMGWLFFVSALKHAPAAMVSPFSYSQIITGAALGYILWGDMPTHNMLAGAAVIIFSGLVLAGQAKKAAVV